MYASIFSPSSSTAVRIRSTHDRRSRVDTPSLLLLHHVLPFLHLVPPFYSCPTGACERSCCMAYAVRVHGSSRGWDLHNRRCRNGRVDRSSAQQRIRGVQAADLPQQAQGAKLHRRPVRSQRQVQGGTERHPQDINAQDGLPVPLPNSAPITGGRLATPMSSTPGTTAGRPTTQLSIAATGSGPRRQRRTLGHWTTSPRAIASQIRENYPRCVDTSKGHVKQAREAAQRPARWADARPGALVKSQSAPQGGVSEAAGAGTSTATTARAGTVGVFTVRVIG